MAQIVVVEDDPDLARLLTDLLGEAGHTVHAAVDAEEGIALIRRVQPDLALVDMSLPGSKDGFDVARSVRATPEVRDLPIWALTGSSRAEDRRRGQEAGISDYLLKPHDIPDLLPRIQELLG